MKKRKEPETKIDKKQMRKLTLRYSLLFTFVFLTGALIVLSFLAVEKNLFPKEGDILDGVIQNVYIVVAIVIGILILLVLFKLFVYQAAYQDADENNLDEEIKITETHVNQEVETEVHHAEIITGHTNVKVPGSDSESRFPTLSYIDRMHETLDRVKCDPALTMESLCYNFREYAAGELKLYYTDKDIRSFIAGLGTSRIMLLQGMSGTGKTSLPVAFGKFIQRPTTVVPVQPTWKERSDLIGYYNEFTGKFSETPLLTALYEAGTTDSIKLIVLDEVNIARIEYYFAEFLSLLELPDQNSRILQVASSQMEHDPKRMINGAMMLPENVFFIGTANNDDSTFSISDKVYDRASVIDLDTRARPFRPEPYQRQNVSFQRLRRLNNEALRRYELTDRDLGRISKVDEYLRMNFQVSFGNRIMRQIRTFVPIYVACGGSSSEAVDVILSKKVLRKLGAVNPVLLKSKRADLESVIVTTFGEKNAPECLASLRRLAEN